MSEEYATVPVRDVKPGSVVQSGPWSYRVICPARDGKIKAFNLRLQTIQIWDGDHKVDVAPCNVLAPYGE